MLQDMKLQACNFATFQPSNFPIVVIAASEVTQIDLRHAVLGNHDDSNLHLNRFVILGGRLVSGNAIFRIRQVYLVLGLT